MAECHSGVYVDGACDDNAGIKVPKIGGTASYYTSLSCVYFIVAAVLFIGVLAPIMYASPQTLGQSMGLNLGLLPFIIGGCVNSLGVWFGSQTMQATGYRLWDTSKVDPRKRKVTISSNLMDKIFKSDFMVHTLPALGAMVVLGCIVGMCSTCRVNKGAIVGMSLAWVLLLSAIYLLIPVSKSSYGVSAYKGVDKTPHSFAPDADDDDYGQELTGDKKVQAVYDHPRPWMAMLSTFAVSLVATLGVGALLR